MIAFIIRRLLWLVPVLVISVTTTFLLIRISPGSPFLSDKAMSKEVRAELEIKYGLNGTLPEQVLRYWGNLLCGDLGISLHYKNRTVSEILAQTLPASLMLGSIAFVLAVTIGTALGAYAACHHGRTGDMAARLVALTGICAPSFLTAPLLILLFAIQLGVLPVAGWGEVRHMILPAACLSIPYIAYVARLMRVSLLEVLKQDWIRTAQAKGLSDGAVLWGHALKNALIPLISFSGPLAAHLLTGSLVIEQIFKIPGMGMFFVSGVLNSDVFLVGGCVVIYCSLLVLFNLLADVLYAVVDKRIQLQ